MFDIKGIIAEERINNGRQQEIDMLRGFAALVLIECHVILYLGNHAATWLLVFGDVSGSEFGAPIFMAAMGISMVYSSHQDPRQMLVRGIKLFLAGYVLSFFRSLLPFLILGPVDEWSHVDAFFIVDIFQLAGLSFMLLALLKRLQVPSIVILLISILLVALNQFIMLPEAIAWDSEILTGIVNLFVPVGEWSCFPFLTWFSFPALGYVFGDMVLIRCRNKNRLYGIMLPVGLAGVIYVYYQFYILYPEYTTYYYGNNFYYMGVINVLLTALFIAFAISFWHFAGRILLPAVKTFLSFLSRNLTTLYVISWVIISILIHIQAMCDLEFGTLATVALFVIVLALCAVLTKLYIIIIKHHKTTVQKMQ